MILTICQPMVDKRVKYTKKAISENELDSNGYSEVTNFSSFSSECVNQHYRLDAGGSSLNTMTCLSQKYKNEKLVFVGAIGKDSAGNFLKNELIVNKKFENLDARLEEIIDDETAQCLVLINDKERSLVTKIGAANKLSKNFLVENIRYVKESEIIYLCAFFASAMPDNTSWILENINSNQRLVFNLSYQSLFQSINRKLLDKIIWNTSVLIGNSNEFRALFVYFYDHDPEDFNEILVKIGDKTKKHSIVKNKENVIDNCQKGCSIEIKALICTDGENPTAYYYNGVMGYVNVVPIHDNYIDTCGAGDYFAAGILGGIKEIENGNIEKVIAKAHEFAHEFIFKNSKILNE